MKNKRKGQATLLAIFGVGFGLLTFIFLIPAIQPAIDATYPNNNTFEGSIIRLGIPIFLLGTLFAFFYFVIPQYRQGGM